MKAIKFFILVSFGFLPNSYARIGGEDVKSFNYLTFYFVDNSDGSNAYSMNDEMVDFLRDNLKKLSNRPDNYFFFYGCNGQEQLISTNLASFADSPKLKKYLKNPSKESEYSYDKNSIREYFSEYPVKIKQNMEINIYLSAYTLKRITKEVEMLPTPFFLANELPIYMNISSLKEINIKTNIYINKEIRDEIGEDKIDKYFLFCRESLHLDKSQILINYL